MERKSMFLFASLFLIVSIFCNSDLFAKDFSSIISEKTSNSIGMEMILVKPGLFNMGCATGNFDEKPLHQVEITQPFYMGSTQVTNAQYEQFDPCHKLLRGKRRLSVGDDEAVIYVSWSDAIAFTEWLSKKEGKPYRLPTEAEWEYACRAETATFYHTGDTLPVVYHLEQINRMYPEPVDLSVAKSPPNNWGFYNMHGLVEEWCYDWYGPYTEKIKTDPVGYIDGDFRVTRGGSHNTAINYLRSSNRSGMLPGDKNHLVGFRVVQADMPTTQALPIEKREIWASNVDQSISEWTVSAEKQKPMFKEPIYFQNIAAGANGPLYFKHNHCPDITALPNGDLFATWYSTNSEQSREMAVAAARFRKGEEKWDAPSVFFKVPDRNMHATSIWWDKNGQTIYHFQGVAAAFHWGDLALFMRTSEDNGATWSDPHWINKNHGLHNMPIAGVIKRSNGAIIVPCDAVTAGDGGTAVHISNDLGVSWFDPGQGSAEPVFEEGNSGNWIAGIHAGIVELSDGKLLALGRGNSINNKMPMSISCDGGVTWKYSASQFSPISSGQRLALIRLDEGPLLFASFTGTRKDDKGLEFFDEEGNSFTGYGLFVAISYDDGETWPVRKLMTPGLGKYDGGAWTREFKTDTSHAEPLGYLAATQAPDSVIHLISSRLHYRFNLAWLELTMHYKEKTK